MGLKWAYLGLKWVNLGLKWANLGLKWAILGLKWANSGLIQAQVDQVGAQMNQVGAHVGQVVAQMGLEWAKLELKFVKLQLNFVKFVKLVKLTNSELQLGNSKLYCIYRRCFHAESRIPKVIFIFPATLQDNKQVPYTRHKPLAVALLIASSADTPCFRALLPTDRPSNQWTDQPTR